MIRKIKSGDEDTRSGKPLPGSSIDHKSKDPNIGAFHEKKEKNAKDYNWGWKEKNKLFGKKFKKRK